MKFGWRRYRPSAAGGDDWGEYERYLKEEQDSWSRLTQEQREKILQDNQEAAREATAERIKKCREDAGY